MLENNPEFNLKWFHVKKMDWTEKRMRYPRKPILNMALKLNVFFAALTRAKDVLPVPVTG